MEHISHPCDSPLSCLVHLHGRISVHDCNSGSEQMSGAKDGQGEHAALLALVPQLWVGTNVIIALAKNAGYLQNGSCMLLLTWTYLVSCLFCKRDKKRE